LAALYTKVLLVRPNSTLTKQGQNSKLILLARLIYTEIGKLFSVKDHG